MRANYRPVARGGGQHQLCEVSVSATSSQWWRWWSSEGGKEILRNTIIREDAHWRLSWPVSAAQHPLPPLTSSASQQKISSQWLQCVFLIISAPSCSRGGACSTAALQLLITNKGCIVYQHLQSATGTRCSASCFLISDLGSGLQCCSAAVNSVYGDAGTSAAVMWPTVRDGILPFVPPQVDGSSWR